MFLKKINPFKVKSIAGKLTVLYTLTTLGMLLAFVAFSYLALVAILENANQQFLTDEIRLLRNIMQKHPSDKDALSQEIKWIPEEKEISEYHYYARIFNAKHQKLMETEGMAKIFQNIIFPKPVAADDWPDETLKWTSDTGRQYLLMAAFGKLGNSNETRLIEIALDLTPQKLVLAQYRRNLFYVFTLGVFLAALFGIFVARRGMRALKDITKSAEKITVEQLHQTINLDDLPQELHNLAKALNKMLQRIESAFKRLSQFSSVLAHELRTPINNIMGEAEIALSRVRTPEEYQQVLESSLEECGRLLRMAESVLFLARTENPQSKIKYSKLLISDELKAIVNYYEALASEKKINIRINAEGEVSADPDLFRHAVSNIVSNAIKYSPESSLIILFGSDHEQVSKIEIIDQGIGISEDHLPLVFDRFYRIHSNNSTAKGGMGLGLTIVKSIMDLHKGKIMINSKLNEGTTVILHFPK